MRLIGRDSYTLEAVQDISDESFEGVERADQDTFRFQYDNSEVFLHSKYGEIDAYAIVNGRESEPYLWSIATRKEFRGLGIASRLLKEIIEWYRGKATQIELTTNVNNPAQKLYFDHGFRVIRVLPKYYGGASGLRMRRML